MSFVYDAVYFFGNKNEGYTDYTQVQKWVSGIVDNIESIYGSVSGQRILDVGCAFGYMTNELTLRGAEVTGIDSSAYAIAQAQILFPSLEFLNEDVADQSRRNNYYDMIVGLGIMMCIDTGQGYTEAMDELARVGKNNVDVYILTFDESDFYTIRDQTTWQSALSSAFGGLWVIQDVGDQPLTYDWRVIKQG